MAQEIDINLNVKTEQADKSLGSLKKQFREAQQEVQTLADKFGATSTEAINAAKRAGELNDRIGDAKSLTDAFNPDAKFKSLTASLSGVAGGFAAYQGAMGLAGVESKDLEKQLLKVQSAMAIAQGLQGLGEARDSFRQLKAVAIDAFKGIKTAIGSTGIGLLVIALGTIVAYWDDIKEAVSGVAEEQKKLTQQSKINNEVEEEKLKNLNSQDNILKLQGKSEKEILTIKEKQVDLAIKAKEIFIENQIEENKQAEIGAQRNYEMLKSFIDFVSIPQRFLYETASKAINNIIDLLNKIPGVNIKSKLDETLGDKASDYLAKLGFDPAETKAKGDAVVKESQDALLKLKNDRAAYLLGVRDIDKQAAKDALLTDEEKKKKLDELDKQYNKPVDESFDISGLEALEASNQAKIDADLKYKDSLLSAQELFELQNAQIIYDSADAVAAREEERRARALEKFTEQKDALLGLASNLANGLEAVEGLSNKKSKAAATIKKGIALVDIAISTATALGSAVKEARASAAAAQALFPLVPGVGIVAGIASYASSAAMVLGNVAKAKAILSGGGGGGGGGVSASGGGAMQTAPTFNVVGQGGANQIAEGIGARDAQPLKAFVVGSDVTTQQSLNMGIVQNATLG
jgi:Mor family transcriptional regulator